MKILSIRRPQAPGAEVRFDVELSEHLRLFSLQLKRGADGHYRTYAGRVCGKRAASFHPILAEQITRAAIAALEATADGLH